MISILNFGQVIAYLIPGFIGAYALSRISAFLNKLMGLAFDNAFKIEGVVVLLFMSMAIGLIISAIRLVILDKWIDKNIGQAFHFNYSKLLDKDVRAAYDDLIQNSWRFAQFYGNMAVATLILFCFNIPIYISRIWDYWLLTIAFFIAIIILFLAYQSEFKKTANVTKAIFQK